MAISIIETRWDEHEAALRALRQKVFINEQHVPEELEWDGEDDKAIHFLAMGPEQNPVTAVGHAALTTLPSGPRSKLIAR